jgi:hypothetical protein
MARYSSLFLINAREYVFPDQARVRFNGNSTKRLLPNPDAKNAGYRAS